jgi:hypothetical protein
MPQTRYTREEIVRRGQALYDEQIGPQIEAENKGKFLVVNIETGEYELDTDELAALRRAKSKNPDAPLYLLRVGYPATYTLGRQSRLGRL